MITQDQLNEKIKSATSVLLTGNSDSSVEELISFGVLFALLTSHYNIYVVPVFGSVLDIDQQNLLSSSGIPLDQVTHEIEGLKYIIQIPKKEEEKIQSVTFDEDDHNFYFHILPGNVQFDVENISIIRDEPEFDLVIGLNVEKVEELGDIYSQNPELFVEDKVVLLKERGEETIYSLIMGLLSEDNITPDTVIAQNLLNLILLKQAKNQFENTEEQDFLSIAKTLAWGADYKKAYDLAQKNYTKKEEKKDSQVRNISGDAPLFPRPRFPRTNSMNNSLTSSKDQKDENRFNPAGV